MRRGSDEKKAQQKAIAIFFRENPAGPSRFVPHHRPCPPQVLSGRKKNAGKGTNSENNQKKKKRWMGVLLVFFFFSSAKRVLSSALRTVREQSESGEFFLSLHVRGGSIRKQKDQIRGGYCNDELGENSSTFISHDMASKRDGKTKRTFTGREKRLDRILSGRLVGLRERDAAAGAQ